MKFQRNPALLTASASISLLLALISCSTPKEVFDTKDLSYLYNPLKNSINPRYSVFTVSDESTLLSMKLMANEMFFSEANPRGVPMAAMFISVRLYNTSQGRILSDTAFYDLDIVKEASREDYTFKVPLKTENGMEYVADVKLMDKLRQIMVQSFVPFNTISEYSRYNFLIRGHFMKNEISRPIVQKDQYFNIIYSGIKPDTLYVSYFKPYNEFPHPPTMVLPEKPGATEADTTVAIAYSDTTALMLPEKGIYFCKIDTNRNEGFTIFNFGPEFPSMSKPEPMIEPLAYIANSAEMETMKWALKQKIALDDFWIKCGGNIDKARELIRIYYTRVLYANYYFTSHKEGWRTDRGMIYIIYGPPDKLYKSNNEESWGYRKPPVSSRWGSRYKTKEDYLYFTFTRRESKFSDNEYSLTRSETVISHWDQAVLAWRKGVVFRLDNPSDI